MTTLIVILAGVKGEGAWMAERLVGRGEELAGFDRGLAEVEDGQPRAIALSGSPASGRRVWSWSLSGGQIRVEPAST